MGIMEIAFISHLKLIYLNMNEPSKLPVSPSFEPPIIAPQPPKLDARFGARFQFITYKPIDDVSSNNIDYLVAYLSTLSNDLYQSAKNLVFMPFMHRLIMHYLSKEDFSPQSEAIEIMQSADASIARISPVRIIRATVSALKCGGYKINGRFVKVDLKDALNKNRQNKCIWNYEEIQESFNQLDKGQLKALGSQNNIFLLKKDIAASTLQVINETQGKKTAILNLASNYSLCGGMLKDSVAQEEAIAKEMLAFAFLCLSKEQYPLETSEDFSSERFFKTRIPPSHMKLIYSTNMAIVNTTESCTNKWLQEKDIRYCDMITMPFWDLRDFQQTTDWINGLVRPDTSVEDLMNNPTYAAYVNNSIAKIEAVLQIAIIQGNKNIVLGAAGCGVFGNNPTFIAKIFLYLLKTKKYAEYFEKVYFSILPSSILPSSILPNSKVPNNPDCFEKVFGKYLQKP